MKTPIEMLNAIIEMQEANYGNGMNTHMKLSTLVKEAKEVVKNCSIPHVVWQSEQLPNRCKVCGRTDEERLTMTSMCGVSACPY